jgi:hypothetical protein
MKNCRYCKKDISLELFAKNKTTKDGLSYYCKKCCVKKTIESRNREKTINPLTGKTNYTKKYNEYPVNTKDYHKNLVLIRKYNMTLEMYNKMIIDQNYTCAICNRHVNDLPKRLDVDHDHITGQVRGLLCGKCNMGLGYFQDNIDIINKALVYIKLNKV